MWKSIKDKLPVNTSKGIAAIVALCLLGSLDALNQAYGLGIEVPGWVYAVLAAFGITVQPKK